MEFQLTFRAYAYALLKEKASRFYLRAAEVIVAVFTLKSKFSSAGF